MSKTPAATNANGVEINGSPSSSPPRRFLRLRAALFGLVCLVVPFSMFTSRYSRISLLSTVQASFNDTSYNYKSSVESIENHGPNWRRNINGTTSLLVPTNNVTSTMTSDTTKPDPATLPATNTAIAHPTKYCLWSRLTSGSASSCPQGYRTNKVIATARSQGGMNDRAFILISLANIAAHLCARLEFPSPYHSLVMKHNTRSPFSVNKQKNKVSPTHPNFSWDEFINLTLPSNPSVSILMSPGENQAHSEHRLELNTDTLGDISGHWVQLLEVLESQEAPYMATNTNGSTIQIPTTNEALTTSFTWSIGANYFDFVEELRSMSEQQEPINQKQKPMEHCHDYVAMSLPDEIMAMAQILAQSLHDDEARYTRFLATSVQGRGGIQNVSIAETSNELALGNSSSHRHFRVGLHVRRGDAIDDCDTSLSKMRTYLNCSLWQPLVDFHEHQSKPSTTMLHNDVGMPSEKKTVTAATVYFYSDERNLNYRSDLGDLVQDMASKLEAPTNNVGTSASARLRFVDLDQQVFLYLKDGTPRITLSEDYGNSTPPTAASPKFSVPAWKRTNNYYRFQLVNAVVKELRLHAGLERRRHASCQDCDKIRFGERH